MSPSDTRLCVGELLWQTDHIYLPLPLYRDKKDAKKSTPYTKARNWSSSQLQLSTDLQLNTVPGWQGRKATLEKSKIPECALISGCSAASWNSHLQNQSSVTSGGLGWREDPFFPFLHLYIPVFVSPAIWTFYFIVKEAKKVFVNARNHEVHSDKIEREGLILSLISSSCRCKNEQGLTCPV